ncbi:MAG TPA: response regulator [Caulobacteraceae bacterium]
MGLIARGDVRASEADRAVADLMTRPLTVEADTDIDQVCALILSHAEPVVGVVVVRDSLYVGVISTRNLLRQRRTAEGDLADNQRFLDLISHEVRSPMNGVVAVAELLQRQPLSADSQAFVRTILESSQATLRALNDALELSRAEFGEMALEPAAVFLRDVMDSIQAGWQARAAEQGVTLLVAYDGEPDLNATVDAARVRQVFDKLIETAIADGGDGAVEASLRAVRTLDGLKLTGRVRVGGGGLSALRLAEPFAPGAAHSGSRASLGLALCQRIIARMGGSIRTDSNVGAGTTVAFELDVAETVAAAPEGFGEVQGPRGAAHILVVDDNATNRMVAEALCEMFDCTSECAEDGVEAVEAARTGRFDLILMDIRMPRMDGVEAARAIRAMPGPAGAVPIIALTANADPEDAKTYIESGMHSVVEKPIKPERLLQAINAALPSAPEQAAAAAAA